MIAIAIPTYLGAQQKAKCRQDPSHEGCPKTERQKQEERYVRRNVKGFDCLVDTTTEQVVTCTTPTTSSLLK